MTLEAPITGSFVEQLITNSERHCYIPSSKGTVKLDAMGPRYELFLPEDYGVGPIHVMLINQENVPDTAYTGLVEVVYAKGRFAVSEDGVFEQVLFELRPGEYRIYRGNDTEEKIFAVVQL